MNLKNKTLAITGGTGSFGNQVLDGFLSSEIKEIVIISRDEKKQDDMRKKYNNDKLKFKLADVRDVDAINDALIGVDYLFSAAALKQVPSCEFFPMEAYKTNVIGTFNTIKSAIRNNLEKVVVLSTDKAVYPINAMGMSKAMMEKMVISEAIKCKRSSQTKLCITRYGNVMGSRGSVIPLFIEQIMMGNDLTVTDAQMTRFMMSLQEAVKLVFFAFENVENGEVFVQKSPGATVETLIESLSIIFNKKLKIKVIGTRHGEKKHEVLVNREEMSRCEDLGNFFKIKSDNRELNYSNYLSKGEKNITTLSDYTSENTKRLNAQELSKILMNLDFIKQAL